MRLTYHPDAEEELIEAAQYYEKRVSGLGHRFLREYDAAISDIEKTPELWPVIEDGLRRHVMRRFPYAIYYRVQDEELRILVVMHHSRHPDYWRYRLNP
jgi:plasmid stabilization system protein ParE